MGRLLRAPALLFSLLYLALTLGGCSAIAGLGQFTKETCADGCDGGTDGAPDARPDGSMRFSVGGSVTGLQGTGLELTDGIDSLSVKASGAFTFPTRIPTGTKYAVMVSKQPTAPLQECVVSGGAGTVGTGDVTSVVVNCTTDTFTVGGTVSGLLGTVVLQDNAGDDLTLKANGSFAFSTPIAIGASYAVTVLTQPAAPSQTCVVGNGNGTIGNANVTSVTITCTTDDFTVGGSVFGLSGSGLMLQDNGGDTLAIAGNGFFTFATPLASGLSYAVTILSQPTSPAQLCKVTTGAGVVTTAAVKGVQVICTTQTYSIGGSLSGLASGNSVVLQDNGGDNLTLAANGSFTFANPIASGATYAVTVLTQPASPLQVCTVSGGTGTVGSANITSIAVNCTTDTFAVGGTVSGLLGALVLQDNGGDNLTLTANGSFAFATPIPSGATYAVTVLNQPTAPSQVCVVSSGSGTVTSAAITSVIVTCKTNSFTVGGNVSGLAGSGLTLLDNGGDSLSITGNGAFTFATSLASGSAFSVTASSQPTSPSQTCTVTGGSGIIGGANVTSVTVTCKTQTFTVGGTLLGLDPGDAIVLQDDAGDNLTLITNGSFTFATALPSGKAYAVTVFSQPTSPSQTCTVSGGTGTVSTANVTSVIVNCGTNSFTVGGTIFGLAGTVVLQDDGGDNLTLTSNGSFAFPTPKPSGGTYVVTVLSQPTSPAQTCTVSAGTGTGTVGSSNVTTVVVNCATDFFTVGGTISGLGAGDTVVLQDNGIDNLPVSANGSFTFTTPIASGATYAVTVFTQPASPISQVCVVTNANGGITTANITNVTIACTTNFYTVGGKVSGLMGSGLVLQNNGGNNLSIGANGSFTFVTSIASGTPYAVTVLSQPATPTQLCLVASSSGTMGGSNVTTVMVTCTTQSFTISGSVGGLTSGSVVLQDNGGDNLTLSTNGAFTFATAVLSGNPYAVTVLTQPPSPLYCYVTSGSGIVGGGNVVGITVTCTTTQTTCATTLAVTPGLPSGIYLIDVDGPGPLAPFNAYCDMTTDGGGWTLLAWTGNSASSPYGVPYPGLAYCATLDCLRGSGASETTTGPLIQASTQFAKAQSSVTMTSYGPLTAYQNAGKYVYGSLAGMNVAYAAWSCSATGGVTGTYTTLVGTVANNGASVYLAQDLAYSSYNTSSDSNTYIYNVGTPTAYCDGSGVMPGSWVGTWTTCQYGPFVACQIGAHSLWVR